jgi:DNA-binding SARP family transcriptional activator
VIDPTPHLRLLGAFQLILNHQVLSVTTGSQRLIAFLALHNRPLPRMYIAGALWPEVPSGRANANLRAGLWRLPQACRLVIDQSAQDLRLADIRVDLRDATTLAQRLLDRTQDCADGQLASTARMDLSADLLPTWDEDDWVLVERERFYQLRLHALEALCERLITAGRYGEAIDAGLAAVAAEPLRESAHRVLIKAHLAEGNQGEANRQYELCRHILRDELGVEPSTALRALLPKDRRVELPRSGGQVRAERQPIPAGGSIRAGLGSASQGRSNPLVGLDRMGPAPRS